MNQLNLFRKQTVLIYLMAMVTLSVMIFLQPNTAKAAESYIRVGILLGQSSVTVSANNDFVIKDIDNKKNYKYKKLKTASIKQQERKVFVDKNGKVTTTLVVAAKDNAPVIVNGKRYRGSLIIQPHKAGLTVINRLPIDEYLYGVIPEEMPANWAKEALKAQAVAARTYALYDKMDGKHTSQGFDVCATTDCQVYGGMDSEAASANNAVNETKGKILTYNREPICAVFHAASGGSTENSEDAWGVKVPYLRAVDDSSEKSPYTQWSKDLSVSEFSRIVSQKFGGIDTVKEIDTRSFKQDPNKQKGKTKIIRITGKNKKVVEVTGAELRSALGLKSSNFTINVTGANKKVKSGDVKKIDKPDKETVNIEGSGFGHRLGLSQWGAKSLADSGENYQQILLHYYTNVKIANLK